MKSRAPLVSTGRISSPRSSASPIVCGVLYLLAYKPILQMLEARREQITRGLADAEKIKAELAAIESSAVRCWPSADAEGRELTEDARAAPARAAGGGNAEVDGRRREIIGRAHEAAEREHAQMLAELKREVGRLVVQTSAAVTGKILTPEDHRRLAEETARQLAS